MVNGEGKKDPRCTGGYEESHHGLFPAQAKGQTSKEWRHFLDSPYNHCASCHVCNFMRVGDSFEARCQFLLLQIKKFGTKQMMNYLASGPDDAKERYEWKRYMEVVNGQIRRK